MTEQSANTAQPEAEQTSLLISIYIPTHNRAALLARALDSVFSQTYRNFELLVVDDGSDDDTPIMLKHLAGTGQLRYFRLESCRGAPAARNFALLHANGDLVTGIDDDDVWLPDRLSKMVSLLKPGVGFVAASDILERDGGRRYIWRRPSKIRLDDLLRRNVVGNQVLVRRVDILGCGGFDESLLASQDYDLWIRLAAYAGTGAGLSTPLQIIHSQSCRSRISTSHKRRSGLWRVYKKHVSKMKREQRKSHLFNMIRNIERPISLRTALTLASRGNAVRVVAHFLRQRLPSLDRVVIKIAGWRDRAEIRLALADTRLPDDQD